MQVTIGVAAYNCLDYSKDTMDSLSRVKDVPFHLVVVDNGSTDGSKPYFTDYFKDKKNFTYIDNEKNLGAPKAWNQIIDTAKQVGHDDVVYILNNDVILGSNWLTNLNKFVEATPNIGVVSSHVVDGLYTGEKIKENYDEWFRWTEAYYNQTGTKVDVGAHYCGFGITKACLDAVGGFDEGYYKTSYEDADYTLRAEESGFQVLTTYNSVLFHYGGVTQHYICNIRNEGNSFQQQNRRYFENKFSVYLDGSICSRSIFWDKNGDDWKRRIPVS